MNRGGEQAPRHEYPAPVCSVLLAGVSLMIFITISRLFGMEGAKGR
jgi:hypothetical protein